jgi:outer membrane protein TolC
MFLDILRPCLPAPNSEHLGTLRSAADLAAENLRLNVTRYQTDEAVALEVVDAQNSLM